MGDTRYNICCIDSEKMDRTSFEDAFEVACSICLWVQEHKQPAMINFNEGWYCEGVLPAFLGANNRSIGFSKSISKSEIFKEIQNRGYILSAVSGYEDVFVVDKVGYKEFHPATIILPEKEGEETE